MKEDSTTNKSVPGELLKYISLKLFEDSCYWNFFFALDNLTSLVPVVVVFLYKFF